METIDLNKFWNQEARKYKSKTFTVTLTLTREEMCDALKCDFVFIDGEYYDTPKDQLLHLIHNEMWYSPNEFNLVQLETE